MAHAIETEHGETEDGKNIYGTDEHERLGEHTDRMSDEQFEDWSRAKIEGRVVSDDAGGDGPDEDADLSDLPPDEKAKRLGQGR
jgi:hypothetical protein